MTAHKINVPGTGTKWHWRDIPFLLGNVTVEIRLCREVLTQIRDDQRMASSQGGATAAARRRSRSA